MFSRTLRLNEAYSERTLVQSQPSSSATIIGMAVSTPSPISDLAQRMVTVSSGSMTIQALTSPAGGAASFQGAPPARDAAGAKPGMETPIASPPAAVTVATRKLRRVRPVLSIWPIVSAPRQFGGAMDRGAQPWIGAAAADIGQVVVDIGVGRVRDRLQQRHGGHDLAGLPIAALRHILGDPGALYRMAGI